MSIEDDIQFLERVPTLSLLGRHALRIIAIGAETRYVHTGDSLFKSGDASDCAYVVQEGSFKITPGAVDPARPEMVAGPGRLLDELALLVETTRLDNARAQEPSTVIRIPRSLFLKMLEGFPEAAQRLRETMATRADRINGELQRVRKALGDIPVQRG